jgi:hypothetical protein
MRVTFVADGRGRCRACGERIAEGDTCTYDKDERVVHVECAEDEKNWFGSWSILREFKEGRGRVD